MFIDNVCAGIFIGCAAFGIGYLISRFISEDGAGR